MPAVPKALVWPGIIGRKVMSQDRTWVLMAHRKGVQVSGPRLKGLEEYAPAVIAAFQPQAVDVVVDGMESDAEIEAYLKRGLRPVKVVRDVDAPLPLENATGVPLLDAQSGKNILNSNVRVPIAGC